MSWSENTARSKSTVGATVLEVGALAVGLDLACDYTEGAQLILAADLSDSEKRINLAQLTLAARAEPHFSNWCVLAVATEAKSFLGDCSRWPTWAECRAGWDWDDQLTDSWMRLFIAQVEGRHADAEAIRLWILLREAHRMLDDPPSRMPKDPGG